MKLIKYINNLLTVNRYYKMSDADLENEVAKWNIKEYLEVNKIPGMNIISRKKIIEQLNERHKANNSRIAILISLLALIISVIALFTP